MTSELKPLDVWDDATNAVCQTMQENKMCNCPDGDCLAAKIEPPEETIRHWNTRAVPDVPELVRYHIDSGGMERCDDGDFCIYSEAAAVLAAKDAEIERLKEALQEIANSYTAHGYNDAVDAVVNLQYIAKDYLNAKR